MTDDGRGDPRLIAALAGYDGATAARAEVLAALATARVFVAITATSTAEHVAPETGLRAESSAEMALVSMVASDGERAVPAFCAVGDVPRWRGDVRPVPVAATYLARAVLDDGAAALLLDPLGAAVPVRRPELETIADGYVPVAGGLLATRRTTEVLTTPPDADPDLIRALAAALGPERPRAARLLAGPGGLVLGVAPRRPLDPPALAALAQRVLTRLGPALPAAGLDLAVVPPTGPGHPVIRRRWR